MVVLEVGIDARGAVTGGQQATGALNGLASAAATVFQSFNNGNAAMAAFGARLALVATGVGAAATALGAVSAVMAMMAQNTARATQEWEKLGNTLQRVTASRSVAGMFGDESLAAGGRRKAIGALFERATDIRQEMMLGSARRVGLDSFLSAQGGNLTKADLESWLVNYRNMRMRQLGGIDPYLLDPSRQGSLSPEEQVAFLAERGRYLVNLERGELIPGMTGPVQGPAMADGRFDAYADPLGDQGYGMGPFRAGTAGAQRIAAGKAAADERRKAAQQESEASLQRQLDYALQISDALADGVTNFAFGLSSARDVAAQMLYQIASGLSREAMGQLTTSIVRAFNGK